MLTASAYIEVNNYYAAKEYPEAIRVLKFEDDTGKVSVFLNDNFNLPAADIAQLCKHRWKTELFFKWAKQHLKIKSFWGSERK